MAKIISSVPFSGTPEQQKQLEAIIVAQNGDKSKLMFILQQAQEIYGYLPSEVQMIIALGIDIPLEEVYGVVTFYSQFSLYPKGEYKVSVCLGTACYVRGAGDVFDKISRELNIKSGECTADGKFSLDACRCIGACGLAPVLTVNDEVYGKISVDDVSTILAKYN